MLSHQCPRPQVYAEQFRSLLLRAFSTWQRSVLWAWNHRACAAQEHPHVSEGLKVLHLCDGFEGNDIRMLEHHVRENEVMSRHWVVFVRILCPTRDHITLARWLHTHGLPILCELPWAEEVDARVCTTEAIATDVVCLVVVLFHTS